MTVCLINISFIDRLLSQSRAVFFCLGIKKISSLSKKKKYYVQVRTYKTVSKVNYYSSWSGKKTVVTK